MNAELDLHSSNAVATASVSSDSSRNSSPELKDHVTEVPSSRKQRKNLPDHLMYGTFTNPKYVRKSPIGDLVYDEVTRKWISEAKLARRNLRRASRTESEGDDHFESDSGSDEEYSKKELNESIESSEEEETGRLGSIGQTSKANSVPHFLPYISFSNPLPSDPFRVSSIDCDDSYPRRNLSENDLQPKRVPIMFQATSTFGSFSLLCDKYARLAMPSSEYVVTRKANHDDDDENESVGADILDSPLDSPVKTSFATLPQEIAEFNPRLQDVNVSDEVHDETVNTIQQIMNNTIVDTPVSFCNSDSDGAKNWPTEEATEISDFDVPTLNIGATSSAEYSSSQDLYGSVRTEGNVANVNVPAPAVKRKRGANIERNVEIFESIIAQNPPGECDESTRPGIFGKPRNMGAFNNPEVENGIDLKGFDDGVLKEDCRFDMKSVPTPEDYSQADDDSDAEIERLNNSAASVVFESTATDYEHPLFPLLMTRMLNNSPIESQDALKAEGQRSDELADNGNGHIDNEAKIAGASEEDHTDEGKGQEKQQQQEISENVQNVQGGNGDGGDNSDDESEKDGEGDEADSSEEAKDEDDHKDKDPETKIEEMAETVCDNLITNNGNVPQINGESEVIVSGNEHLLLLADNYVNGSNLAGSSQLRTSQHDEIANGTEEVEIVGDDIGIPQEHQIDIPADETAQVTGNQILTLPPYNVGPQSGCQHSLNTSTSVHELTEDQNASPISNDSDASNESINSAASNNPQTITVINDNEPVDISLVNHFISGVEEFDSPTLSMPGSSSVVELIPNNLVASDAGSDDIDANEEEFDSPTLSMPRSSSIVEPVSNNIPNVSNADEVNSSDSPDNEEFDNPTLVLPRSPAPQSIIIEPAETNPLSAQQIEVIGGEGGDDDGDDDNGDSLHSAFGSDSGDDDDDNGVNISKAPKQSLDQNGRGIGINLLNMLSYGFIPSSHESSEYSSSDESEASRKLVEQQVTMRYPVLSKKSKKNKLSKRSDRRIVDSHSSTVLQSNYYEVLGGAESSPSLASTSELAPKTVESGDFRVIITIVVISALSLAALGYIAKKLMARKKTGIDLEVEGRRN